MAKGWREKVEPGIHRHHTATCPRSTDHREGGRCGCSWQIKVPGSRPRSSVTVTLRGVTLAEARNERRRRLAAGRPEVKPATSPGLGTLDDLAGEYLRYAEPLLSLATIRGYDDAYRLDVSPHIGAMPPESLDLVTLDGWWSGLLRTTTRDRARRARAALSAIMAQGERWGRCTNLATELRVPPPEAEDGDPEVRRVLTPEQIARLADSCDLPGRVAVRLAADAGLRRGEVIGVKWGDLDLDRRRLTVHRSVAQERGATVKDEETGKRSRARRVEQTTKGKRRREVPLTAALAADLAEWWGVSVMEKGNGAAGYILPGRDGGPMGEGTPSQAMARAMDRAGLVDEDGKALASFHGLRHSFVTNALRAGLPLLVVSRVAGHADPSITAKVYAHVIGDDHLDEVANAFDRMAEVAREEAK